MPEWLIQIVTNAGPTAAIMAYMWWQERRERIHMTNKLLAVLEGNVELGEAVRAVLNKKTDGEK